MVLSVNLKNNILLFFVLFISLNFYSCKTNRAQKCVTKDSIQNQVKGVFTGHVIDSVKYSINLIPKGNYNYLKERVITKREEFKELYLNAGDIDTQKEILGRAREYFCSELLNDIFPHWYGTVWDFDGYTNIPNQGIIACGYFISTTLKHMGVNMNRYRFAQQAGLNGAKTLSPSGNYKVYTINSTFEIDSFISKIENDLKPGLYTVGLSNHVGFIYIENKTAYFIHSNYIDGYVMTEKARYSDAFQSMIYVITDITYNDYLIESWILNKEIPVVTD